MAPPVGHMLLCQSPTPRLASAGLPARGAVGLVIGYRKASECPLLPGTFSFCLQFWTRTSKESEAYREQYLRRHTLSGFPRSQHLLNVLHTLYTSLTSSLSRPDAQNTRGDLFKKSRGLAQRMLANWLGRMSLQRECEFRVSGHLWGPGVKAKEKQANGPWLGEFSPREKDFRAALSGVPHSASPASWL